MKNNKSLFLSQLIILVGNIKSLNKIASVGRSVGWLLGWVIRCMERESARARFVQCWYCFCSLLLLNANMLMNYTVLFICAYCLWSVSFLFHIQCRSIAGCSLCRCLSIFLYQKNIIYIYILFSATFRLSLYHIWWIKRFTESIDTRAFGCWIFMKLFLFVVVAFADALLVICLNSLSFAQSVFRAPSNKLFSYCKFSFRMKFLRNKCGN